MGRGVAIALALSLAGNVFLGGFVAGRLAGGPGLHHGSPGFDMRRGIPEDFADLPPIAREALKRAFIEHRAEGRKMMREARSLHRDFTRVLGADTWDRAAAEAIIGKLEAAEIAGRTGMAKILVEVADDLSMEDRKALAAVIAKKGDGEHRHRRGRRDRWRAPATDDINAAPAGETPVDEAGAEEIQSP